MFALPIMIIPFVMQADALRRRYAFWQSLPISRSRLLLAKGIAVFCGFVLLPLTFEIAYYYLAGLEPILWNSLLIWLFLHLPVVYFAFFICYLTAGWKSYFCVMIPVSAILVIVSQQILLGGSEKIGNHITNTFTASNITTMPSGSTANVNANNARLNAESKIKYMSMGSQSQTFDTTIQPVFELIVDNLPPNIVIDHIDQSLKINIGEENLSPNFQFTTDAESSNGEYAYLAPGTEQFYKQSIVKKPDQPTSHRYECIVDEPIKVDYGSIPDSGLIVRGKILVKLSEKITLGDFPIENNARWKHRNHEVRLSLTTNSPEYSFVQGELDLYAVFTDDNIFEKYRMEFPERGVFIVAENNQVALRTFEMHYSADDFMKRERGSMDISRYLKTNKSRLHFDYYNPSNWDIRGDIAISRFTEQMKGIQNWRVKVITYAPIGTVEIPVEITIPKSELLRRPLDDSKINQFPPLSLEEQIESISYDDEKQALADLHRLIGQAHQPSQVSSLEHLIYPSLTKIFKKNPELLMKELKIYCIQCVTSKNERTWTNMFHWHDYSLAIEISPFWQRVNDFLTTAVRPEHKDLVIRHLHPIIDQSDLLERMGWEQEAVPILAKMFQQERMPQCWIELLRRYPSVETDKALLKQLEYSIPQLSRIIQWIDSISDQKKKMEIIDKVWQQTTLHSEGLANLGLPLLIALKHGNANAPNDIRLLAKSDGETIHSYENQILIDKQWLGIYQIIALFSDCPPEPIKGREWLLQYGDKLTWNESNSRYEISPASMLRKDFYDEAKWGKLINPLGVGSLDASLEKDQIRVTASAYPIDYGDSFLERYAPRMMQQVTGDFTAEVTVAPQFSASPSWSGNAGDILQASGLVLEAGQSNNLKLATILHGGKLQNHIRAYISRSADFEYTDSENNSFDAKKTVTLRITRHGDEFTTAWKQEGLDWQENSSQFCRQWPKSLHVGLYVTNLCVKPFSAIFSNFEIKNSSGPPRRSGIAKNTLTTNSLPNGSVIQQWGSLDSPFNSGLVDAKNNCLRVGLLPRINDYNFSTALVAPVTINRVKGDFVQEVTVAPIHEANWFGEYIYFRNGNAHLFRFGPGWKNSPMMDIHASGLDYPFYTPPHNFQVDFKQPMRLRLRRVGKLFYAAVKQGEKDWQEMAPFYLNCAEELEVGVVALNTSDKKLEAVFTDYTLTQP